MLMPFRILALCLLLGGCASLPPAAQTPPPRPPRATIAAFAIDGRIAVHRNGHEYVSGISWRHAAERDEMLLTTPLGLGIAELERDNEGARLTMADRREFRADDLSSLSARMFGIALPLAALPRWLVANVSAPMQPGDRDAAGRPQSRTIDGWHIVYGEYESDGIDALPTRIELRHDEPEAIDVRLKIDEWVLPP